MTPLTRDQLAAHIDEYVRDGGAAENPEYSGDVVDWMWDWLVAQSTLAPATDPPIRWLQLRVVA